MYPQIKLIFEKNTQVLTVGQYDKLILLLKFISSEIHVINSQNHNFKKIVEGVLVAAAVAVIWTAGAGPWPALFLLPLVVFFPWSLDQDGAASNHEWPDDTVGRFLFSV